MTRENTGVTFTIDDDALNWTGDGEYLRIEQSADVSICRLAFLNTETGESLLRECTDGGALRLRARAHNPRMDGAESPTVMFEANAGEHIYGMGEYQQPVMDLKGSTL